MVQMTYYPPRGETLGPPEQIRTRQAMHGYTMDDLHQAAIIATSTKRYLAADRHDLYQAAWDGIIDLLCEVTERPRRYDLVRAGQAAIQKLRDEFIHTYGYSRERGEVGAAAAFNKFWGHSPVLSSPVEDAVVERMASRQILAALPAHQRRALVARAAADTQQQAADLAMLTYSYMGQLVRDGRQAFMALWHQGETPRSVRRRFHQRRVRDHQPCGTPAGYGRHRYLKERPCDDCRAAMTKYAAGRRATRRGAAP
jgi:hypothetical protein